MHRRPCRSQNLLIYTTVLPKPLTNLSVYSRPSQLYYFPVRRRYFAEQADKPESAKP
jgi:hypothetical protein